MEVVDCIYLTHDRENWRILPKTLWFNGLYKMREDYLLSEDEFSFQGHCSMHAELAFLFGIASVENAAYHHPMKTK